MVNPQFVLEHVPVLLPSHAGVGVFAACPYPSPHTSWWQRQLFHLQPELSPGNKEDLEAASSTGALHPQACDIDMAGPNLGDHFTSLSYPDYCAEEQRRVLLGIGDI